MALCIRCKAEETELYENGAPMCLRCADARYKKACKKPPASSKSIQDLLVDEIVEATSRTNQATQAFLGRVVKELMA